MRNGENTKQDRKEKTLREILDLVSSTRDIRIPPRAKTLRDGYAGNVVAWRELGTGCIAEVYESGFIVYEVPNHRLVLRIEDVLFTAEESRYVRDIGVPLTDLDWIIAVVICGDEQLERNTKIAKTRSKNGELRKFNGMSGHMMYDIDDGDSHDCDFADTVDIEGQVVSAISLEQALLLLTEREREIVELYYLEEYTEKTIAQILRLGRTTVQTTRYRAIEKMRISLM